MQAEEDEWLNEWLNEWKNEKMNYVSHNLQAFALLTLLLLVLIWIAPTRKRWLTAPRHSSNTPGVTVSEERRRFCFISQQFENVMNRILSGWRCQHYSCSLWNISASLVWLGAECGQHVLFLGNLSEMRGKQQKLIYSLLQTGRLMSITCVVKRWVAAVKHKAEHEWWR